MLSEFEKKLEKYAEVILKVGLNFQPKQRLLIGGPSIAHDGVSFEAAPLVRIIAKKAYQMGASLVDVVWADEQLRPIRFKYGSKKSLRLYPKWRIDAKLDIAQAGDAYLDIMSPRPDLLEGVDLSVILKFQLFLLKHLKPLSDLTNQFDYKWLIIAAPNQPWADKILPHIHSNERVQKLWDIIFEICRIKEENPVSAWEKHDENLKKQCNYLNDKQYQALKFISPETDLTIGLPKNHIWEGGSLQTNNGISFQPNIPTEEVFTTPVKDQVEGIVKTTKPVLIEGQIIEDCILKFSKGRIIEAHARVGNDIINKIISIDEGARRLGEIALVPHSSLISKTDLLYFNLLIDENASNHIALGQGFRSSLKNGRTLTKEEFMAAGGNESSIHLDLMIGSRDMNVNGILEDETTEPIMRNGEWAFEV
ncbi:MAG: aminopeptidase [Candidatus Lokiarchaeota archaeon]|nr:aminopeptidase [Candidatus Lokiarchaeota archaeon]